MAGLETQANLDDQGKEPTVEVKKFDKEAEIEWLTGELKKMAANEHLSKSDVDDNSIVITPFITRNNENCTNLTFINKYGYTELKIHDFDKKFLRNSRYTTTVELKEDGFYKSISKENEISFGNVLSVQFNNGTEAEPISKKELETLLQRAFTNMIIQSEQR